MDTIYASRTRFHKIMVLFDRPALWSNGQTIALLALMQLPPASAWWIATRDVQITAASSTAVILFSFSDGLLFWSLTKRGMSFGSWKSQTIVIAVMRIMASVMWALLALVVVDSWSLLGLLTTQLIASAALYWGTAIEPFNLGMTKVIFRHGAISPEKPPLRILHLSDLHIERLTKREGRLLDLVQDADADLVLITGDYLNLSWIRDETAQKDLKALLTQLSAPYGVYAVLGSPPVDERDVVPALFDGLDIDLLVNENRVIDLPGRVRILLIGADCTHDLQKDRASLSNMHKNEPEHDLSILLYHSPDLFDDAVEHGVALYLCGHTHGGQVRIPGYGALLTSSEFGRRFQMGLYEERETRMYISRGVGLEGLSAPRMRLFCPPEIELIEYASQNPSPKRD